MGSIVGINEYDDESWGNLTCPENDAIKFMETLINYCGFNPNNIILLTNQDFEGIKYNYKPTRENIKTAIVDVLRTKVTDDDLVLFFFAGHGDIINPKSEYKKGYLIAQDSYKYKLESTAIKMDDIRDWADILPVKAMLFLIDSCFSGMALTRYRGNDVNIDKDFIDKIAGKKRVRYVITAGENEELVGEKEELGHSFFTQKLIEGLRTNKANLFKDSVIHSGELGNYLHDEVTKFTHNNQTPQFGSIDNQPGVVIVKSLIPGSNNTEQSYSNTEGIEEYFKIKKKKKSLYKKWWFWGLLAGAGAAVAAGGGSDAGSSESNTGSARISW